MKSTFRLVSALLLLAATARMADAAGVALTPSPSIGPSIAAFPRVAPEDPSARRVNQALDRADARLRDAVKDCLATDSGHKGDAAWTRNVYVAMRGPHYLGLVAYDALDCGGAHPDTGTLALTYDLGSGFPVNWVRLLPAAMVQDIGKDNASDGTVIGTLISPALVELYVKGLEQPIDPDCKDVVSDPTMTLTLWPDAKGDGLAVMPASLAHVVAACGPSVTIPTAVLRKLGVDAGLLNTIDMAHDQGLYDKGQP